ncbi:YfhJ family protein [Bacillus sp. SL00103]
MEQYFERLTEQLMEKNNMLSMLTKARTWVELLWSDLETTCKRLATSIKGQDTTSWIVQNGD